MVGGSNKLTLVASSPMISSDGASSPISAVGTGLPNVRSTSSRDHWRGGLASVRTLLLAASWIGVVVLPIAIVCSILTNLFFDEAFYRAGQNKYQVQFTTGMSFAQIDRVDQGIIRFFAGSESLPRALQASNADSNVFKEKEILHMDDVRAIVQFIGKMQTAGLALLGVLTIVCLVFWRQGGRAALARALTLGSALTILLVILTGVLTYTSFDWLFLTFHEVTFQNNFWELDPATDHLIQMFPFGFWYDAMLTVALRVLIVTLLLGFSGIVLGQFERRRA